jgi:hypothetical protein
MLSDPDSPLRQFLASELPGVAAVRADCRARRPADLDVLRPEPPAGTRPAWGTLGAAVDHRLRLGLSDSTSLGGAVRAGVQLVAATRMDRPVRVGEALRAAGDELLRQIEKLITELRPFDRGALLTVDDEQRLARACVVAAWFEEAYRTGRLWPGTPLGDATEDVTLDRLLALVPDYAVADIVAMADLAAAALADVRASCAPSDVHVGPVFAGSRDVGGADADWIAAGLLVDVKATAAPEKVGREDVLQLASYALLDYDDRYGIERVGWYFARVGWLVTWELAAFLGLLGAAHPMADLRRYVARVLSP